MSRNLLSGKFGKVAKNDSKEDLTVTRTVLSKNDNNIVEKDSISKSKLKPPSTRVIGGLSKKFVVQSATLKTTITKSPHNGVPALVEEGAPQLKDLKSLQAQSDTMTKSSTATVGDNETQPISDSKKHKPILQPRSVLKSSRELNGSDGKEKRKCVTIVDVEDRHKRPISSYNLNARSPARDISARIRRLSEGSNSVDGLSMVKHVELSLHGNSLKSESSESSQNMIHELEDTTKNNAIEPSKLSTISLESNGKDILPGQDLKTAESNEEQISLSSMSTSNGANTNVNIESHTAIPSVKEIGSQIQTGNVDASIELTKKSSVAVVETTADAEKTEEDEEETSHTKSPDGRYIRQNDEIGRGSFKTVFKGLDVETGVAIAWCELMVSISKN